MMPQPPPTLPGSRTLRICRQISFAGLLLVAGSLVTSPAALSIGMIIMILPAFVSMPLRSQLRIFSRSGILFWISLLLIPLFLSWFWTFRKDAWGQDLIIKLPLCLAPYAIAVLGPLPAKKVQGAFWLLLLSVLVAAAGTVVSYLLNKEAVDSDVAKSKPILTFLGSPHIYFSVISAFTVFVAFWLFTRKEHILFRGEKWIALILGLILLAAMHVITTRTGLLAFYITAMITAIARLMAAKKYFLAVTVGLLIISMPVVGYYFVPSLRNRVENTRMDVTRYFAGKDPNYLSIGTRIESYKVAWHIIQKRWWLGVGLGDLKDEMNYQYVVDQSLVCPENQIEPHNQFIQIFAGLGFFSVLLFTFAWFSPLLRRWRPSRAGLFWPFWIIFTLSMMGESMLERQTGVCFLVFCLALTYHLPAPSAQNKM